MSSFNTTSMLELHSWNFKKQWLREVFLKLKR